MKMGQIKNIDIWQLGLERILLETLEFRRLRRYGHVKRMASHRIPRLYFDRSVKQDKLEEAHIQPHPACWSEEMMMITPAIIFDHIRRSLIVLRKMWLIWKYWVMFSNPYSSRVRSVTNGGGLIQRDEVGGRHEVRSYVLITWSTTQLRVRGSWGSATGGWHCWTTD